MAITLLLKNEHFNEIMKMLGNEQVLVGASGKNNFQEIHIYKITHTQLQKKKSNKDDLFLEKSLKKTLLKQQEIIKVKLDTEKFNRIRYKAQHGPNLI